MTAETLTLTLTLRTVSSAMALEVAQRQRKSASTSDLNRPENPVVAGFLSQRQKNTPLSLFSIN